MNREFSAVQDAAPKLEAYYDQTRKEFLVADTSSGWVPISESSLKRIMRQAGFDDRPRRGEALSDIETRLIEIQTSLNVVYAGPVAGYMAGLHETPDARFLVTRSPAIIKGRAAPWPMLESIITGMLGLEQAAYFYGWMKCARAALVSGKRSPGQALAIAGPRECGKSLLQKIVTPSLGGRAARPYQFMSGQTAFNAHLFGAEHLMVEDESPATDHKARRLLGAMVKSLTVNEDQSCHRKNATPVMLRPFWRLTITVNDEPENLMVLPPLDESIEDKIILLKANKKPMPMPTASPDEREAFWKALMAELPGLLHHVDNFAIAPGLISQRFGITHFHNPDLLAKLDGLSPEFKLLSIVELYLLDGRPWRGKAAELEQQITDCTCPYHHEARKLLSWPTACGTFLGRLRQRHPTRVHARQEGDARERVWTIHPRDSEHHEHPFSPFETTSEQ